MIMKWGWYTLLYEDVNGKLCKTCCFSRVYEEAEEEFTHWLSRYGGNYISVKPQYKPCRADFTIGRKNILQICNSLMEQTLKNIDNQLDTEIAIMYGDTTTGEFYLCPLADIADLVNKGETLYYIYKHRHKEGKDNISMKYFKEKIFAVPYITKFPYNKREVKLTRRRSLEMEYKLYHKNIDEVCRGIVKETNLNVEKGLYTQFSVMYDIKKESFYYCDTIDTHVYSKTGDHLYFGYHWEPQYGPVTSQYLKEMIFNLYHII